MSIKVTRGGCRITQPRQPHNNRHLDCVLLGQGQVKYEHVPQLGLAATQRTHCRKVVHDGVEVTGKPDPTLALLHIILQFFKL